MVIILTSPVMVKVVVTSLYAVTNPDRCISNYCFTELFAKISGKFIHSQVVSFFFFLCEYEALNDLCEMT